MAFPLNEEQTAAVKHPQGAPAVLIAGAGSGKTRVLTERIRWLMEGGVQPRRICCITFTNKAAGELKERLGIGINTPIEKEPRVSTIHSLALSGIRKNPKAFGLNDKVTPLDEYDQAQLMKKVIERYDVKHGRNMERDRGFVYSVLEKIGFHRARGVGFRDDYTDAVHQRAMEEHAGYHAMVDEYLDLWELFEDEKRRMSVVDFDDMLHLVVRRMRNDPQWKAVLQKQFDHVLMDEAQDTNPVQWEFVNGLLGPDNPNLYVVGDMGQCQPPGTQVTLLNEPARGQGRGVGFKPSYKQVPIESLPEVGVTSWTKIDQRTYSTPRKVKVASRWYEGSMLALHGENGSSTRVTPNHWLWVRFNKNTQNKYVLYLMYREGYGFRVGTSKFKQNKSGRGFGLSGRLNCEKGHAAWILRVFDTRAEAEAWEEITALKYGIPECVFEAEHACRNKTQEMVKLVFSHADPKGGLRCLQDYGLDDRHPITTRCDDDNLGNRHWRGYFKTIAANVAPLAGLLDIPIQGVNKFTQLSSVTSERYKGLVYSLDVEKDHTYIADGLVVGNSIYGFNGAVPKILKDYSENWRDQTPVMYRIQRNHRSMKKIVYLANKIQKTMTETIPLQMDVYRPEEGTWSLLKLSMPQNVAAEIATRIKADSMRRQDPILFKDNALLVRSGMQVRDLEGELVRRRIPYIVRGGKGLLQTEEVRDILAYLRLVANRKDFTAFMRCCAVPRCGVGEVALNKLRIDANQRFDGDLLEAAKENDKLHNLVGIIDMVTEFKDMPLTAVEKLLALFDYRKYLAVKYAKDRDKVKTKLENIERFIMMVAALTTETTMSLEDLIFQMALDRSKGDETEKAMYDRQLATGELTQEQYDRKMEEMKQGSVTISTIHSAKGLEWRRVFVTNVYEGSLPNRFSMGSDEEIEEERRLFYVACTRARDVLVLCLPEKIQIMGRGDVQRVAPSRFLKEIDALPKSAASN
jgi:DNA helicase-2/ATP-dependent DNA helicase PcrA